MATPDSQNMFSTYGDQLPIGPVDERVLAVHVVEVGEMGFLDLTDGRDQKRSAAARRRRTVTVGHRQQVAGRTERFWERENDERSPKTEFSINSETKFPRKFSNISTRHDKGYRHRDTVAPGSVTERKTKKKQYSDAAVGHGFGWAPGRCPIVRKDAYSWKFYIKFFFNENCDSASEELVSRTIDKR